MFRRQVTIKLVHLNCVFAFFSRQRYQTSSEFWEFDNVINEHDRKEIVRSWNLNYRDRNVHSRTTGISRNDKTCESRSRGVDRLELGIFKTNALSGANDKIQQRDSNFVGNAYSYAHVQPCFEERDSTAASKPIKNANNEFLPSQEILATENTERTFSFENEPSTALRSPRTRRRIIVSSPSWMERRERETGADLGATAWHRSPEKLQFPFPWESCSKS